MNGFSERDTDVAVGHLLGLRWFQLTLRCPRHGQVSGGFCTVRCDRPPESVLKGSRGPWEPGENQAECKRYGDTCTSPRLVYLGSDGFPEHHEVPVRECGCGYWAYWALGGKQVQPPSAVAIVKGYGRTVEGDLGFRCSHARIVALHLPNWDEAAAVALEMRYEVPVYAVLGAMLAMNPAPEGQPPLTDEFFSRGLDDEYRRDARSPVAGRGGGRQPGEPYAGYAARMGFLGGALPCPGCGILACAPGQALCANCQLGDLRRKTEAAASSARRLAQALAEDPRPSLSAADAVMQLHARRESWAATALARQVRENGAAP